MLIVITSYIHISVRVLVCVKLSAAGEREGKADNHGHILVIK